MIIPLVDNTVSNDHPAPWRHCVNDHPAPWRHCVKWSSRSMMTLCQMIIPLHDDTVSNDHPAPWRHCVKWSSRSWTTLCQMIIPLHDDTVSMIIPLHDDTVSNDHPARGRHHIFECYWNGRLITYTTVDEWVGFVFIYFLDLQAFWMFFVYLFILWYG